MGNIMSYRMCKKIFDMLYSFKGGSIMPYVSYLRFLTCFLDFCL